MTGTLDTGSVVPFGEQGPSVPRDRPHPAAALAQTASGSPHPTVLPLTPTRAERRAAGAKTNSGHRQVGADGGASAGRAAAIDVRIEPGDPLLAFLATAPGPVDIEELPPSSPAAAHLRDQGTQIVLPLVASGELVGVLALGPRRSERSYTRNDRKLLDSLGRYAAPALRLAQLMRRQEVEARARERMDQELHVAQLIQQQFLSGEVPDLPGWHVATFYQPARTVGGDFYDLIGLSDGRIMVVAGDVTDKGVPAALVMASTQALLRSTAGVCSSPGEVLSRVNELLVPQIPLNMFVTCLVLVIDPETGATQFANAGHNLPYVRRGGSVVQVSARGMPLGLMAGSRYDELETVIEPGDLVLLYSDGITEQHDAEGEMFGFGRTRTLVAAASAGDDLVARVVAGLREFAGAVEQEDDITLVALHRERAGSSRDAVSFSVTSEAGNEREVMDRVSAVVCDLLPPERLEALMTAVSETAMNAIEHGNRSRQEVDVDVVVRRSPEVVTVEITDYGRGRRLDSDFPEPDLELKLAGLQAPRGWGLFLVKNLVDRVEESSNGDRHVVRLVMQMEEPVSRTEEP